MEVWLVELKDCADALEAEEARRPRLADDDLARIATLADPHLRRQRRLTAIALRGLIAAFTQSDRFDRVAFVRRPGGKPLLADGSLAFSMSHAGGRALIALGHVGTLGVDLEPVRTVRMSPDRQLALLRAAAEFSFAKPPGDVPEIAAGMESAPWAASGSAGGGLGADAVISADRVLQAWVRLEAVAKAQGDGIGRLLTATGVLGRSCLGPAPHRPVNTRLDGLDGLRVRDLVVPAPQGGAAAEDARWFAALATEAPALARVPKVGILSADAIGAAR